MSRTSLKLPYLPHGDGSSCRTSMRATESGRNEGRPPSTPSSSITSPWPSSKSHSYCRVHPPGTSVSSHLLSPIETRSRHPRAPLCVPELGIEELPSGDGEIDLDIKVKKPRARRHGVHNVRVKHQSQTYRIRGVKRSDFQVSQQLRPLDRHGGNRSTSEAGGHD